MRFSFPSLLAASRVFVFSARTAIAIRRPLISPAIKLTPSISLPFMGSFFSSTSNINNNMSYPVQKTDSEWQAVLSPEQFRVLRKKGTERPGTGEYNKHTAPGVYTCVGCDAPLYKSTTKFDSSCGWPAFFEGVPGAIERHEDRTFGMTRIEIVCKNCGGHLGHVFKGEGYQTPTDERHCVNSVSLKFKDAPTESKA